jgi:CheY-like chemotaxis protein
VLIVDDNATNREILTSWLAAWGMRPEEATDGPAAIQSLYHASPGDPFRIAIIDMQMPGMDGEALGRIIQADPRLADTRMVMLTSMGQQGTHLYEIGFAAYASKPVRHIELKAILSRTLAGQPAPQPAAPRLQSKDAKKRYSGRKARILLAEDNLTNQQVALGILKNLGLTADAVANGFEAVHAIKSLPYDIVLMDVQMPVMDGLEATREIRKFECEMRAAGDGFHTIPIVAMTANAMPGDR